MLLNSSLIEFSNTKVASSKVSVLLSSVLAGVFIGLGAFLFMLAVNYSINQFIAGLIFSVGLLLIVRFKSQLFTGNHLLFYSYLSGKLSMDKILSNWSLVFVGNLIGALVLSFICSWYLFHIKPDQEFMGLAYRISKVKTEMSVFDLLWKAFFCNILVCVAVTFSIVLKNRFLRLVGIMLPVATFIFLGLEHSVANMFLISVDIFLNLFGSGFVYLSSIKGFLISNIFFVTIGNLLGAMALCFFYKKISLTINN